MLITPAFAQSGGFAEGGLGLMPIILVMIIFYFLLIRPQQKRAKQHKAMIAAVGRGDKIITNGGLVGKITKVEEQFIVFEAADGIELRLQKSAVMQALPKGTIKGI